MIEPGMCLLPIHNMLFTLEAGHTHVTRGVKEGSLDRSIDRYMDKIGIKEKYSFSKEHSLRKLACKELVNELSKEMNRDKAEDIAVSRFLGHGEKRIDLIERYCR